MQQFPGEMISKKKDDKKWEAYAVRPRFSTCKIQYRDEFARAKYLDSLLKVSWMNSPAAVKGQEREQREEKRVKEISSGSDKTEKMSLAGTVIKRGFATSAGRAAIKHVTVIGGGLMGSGIAQVIYLCWIFFFPYLFHLDGLHGTLILEQVDVLSSSRISLYLELFFDPKVRVIIIPHIPRCSCQLLSTHVIWLYRDDLPLEYMLSYEPMHG